MEHKSDKVIGFPDKKRPDGVFLIKEPKVSLCVHSGSFLIHQDAGKCFCKDCKEEVSPMLVLSRLCAQESLWQRKRADYMDEMRRLHERSRTKCTHCGNMTRISRK